MKGLFPLALCIVVSGAIMAQEVERNYLVGPQSTTCDSLDLLDSSKEKAIELIRASSFRFNQNFRLTRKSDFQGGEYYSCDGEKGYLIIKMDNEQSLYLGVQKAIWDELIKSSDPEGYFLKKSPLWNRFN